MSVDNAIIATDFLKCKKVIGMHYNTFDLIKIDEKEAVEKFNRAGKELILIPIGQSIEL
jgi:L-ascorbate metabolism protein UlaG (beta-lactamase superfamily)